MTSKMLGAPAAQVAGVNLATRCHGRYAGLAIDERSAGLTEKPAKAAKPAGSRKPGFGEERTSPCQPAARRC